MTKAQNERKIFESLVPLAGLTLTPNSIQQKNPPAPDIECQIQEIGCLAVELVAIDGQKTRTRMKNNFSMNDSWESALEHCTKTDQEKLRMACKNINLNISGLNNISGTRDLTKIMQLIQKQLLSHSTDFTGDFYLTHEDISSGTLLPLSLSVKVTRFDAILNGPRINTLLAGSWEMPEIQKITEKLTIKKYITSSPLELWVYSLYDEIDAHIDSLAKIEKSVTENIDKSKFRRVRVFDLLFKELKGVYPRGS